MQFGMNMLLWSTDVTGPEFDPVYELLREIGYDGVEIPIFDADPASYGRLRERLDALDLKALGIAARSEADSPTSDDADVRRRGYEATTTAIDVCETLGSPLLCGPLEAPLGYFSGTRPTAGERARSVESLREVGDYAASKNVTIAIEYLNRFELYLVNTAADAAALVREVDHPNVRMMYDTFHAHIEEKDPRAALEECQDVLVHFHASENDRGTPGTGQVRWQETFDAVREIGYDGWVVIEAFGDALPELTAATKIWRRMFDTEEQLARTGLAFLRQGLAPSV